MAEPCFYNQNELSDLVGVTHTTIGKWRKLSTFPSPNKDGKYLGMDVAEWWFQNRAPKARRMQLVHSADDLAEEMTLADEDRMLDLRLKAHKVAVQIGDVISFSLIRHIVGDLAADIREACQAAQATTGQDLAPIFDEAFGKFERRVNDELEASE